MTQATQSQIDAVANAAKQVQALSAQVNAKYPAVGSATSVPNTPSPGSGNLNTPTTPTPTPAPAPAPTPAPVDPNQTKVDTATQGSNDTQGQMNTEATNFNKQSADAANGALPLNQYQQAQINGITQQYNTWIQQQQQQNTNSQGVANIRGYQTGSAEYDPTFQAKTIGAIYSAGLAKVADLSTKMASAIGSMTSGFETENYNIIKSAHDDYMAALEKQKAAFDKTVADTQKAIKDAQDAQQKVTDAVNAVALEAAKNGADKKTMAAISGSSNVQDAINASGGWLQSASGDLGDYLQYKRDTEAKGLVPTDYQSYIDNEKKKAADLTLKGEESKMALQNKYDVQKIYATAAAKAAADKASGVLSSSQQSLLDKTETRLAASPVVKNFDQVASQYAVVQGIPDGTTDPVEQENLLMAIAQIYVPGAKTVRGVLAALKPEDMQSGVWNVLNDAQRKIEAKGKMSADAVKTLKADAENIYNQNQNAYTSLRNNTVETLKNRGIDDPNSYLSDLTSITRTDPKTEVDKYVSSNPADSEMVAKMYEVPGATDQDIYDYLQANGKIK